MAHPTPLMPLFENAEAIFEPYGPRPRPASPADSSTPPATPIAVAAAFDFIDIEYAAIRKSGCAALLDQPHRGVVEFTGADRLAFLNRMVTQELKDAPSFACRRAFWLNRKGRIDADLRLIILPDRILADLEAFSVRRLIDTLGAFVIADDVTITDLTQSLHRMALHGPGAAAVLHAFSRPVDGALLPSIEPGQVSIVSIGGHEVIVDRWDSTGEIGLELIIPSAATVELFHTLLQAAHQHSHARPSPHSALIARDSSLTPPPPARLKPIGWHAYNVARIEAGTPLYMIDFAGDSLPAEAGRETLHDRVSFKKGCYLGQEIVARMNALGHPKQTLVALHFHAPSADVSPALPPSGAPVFAAPLSPGAEPPPPIGTIASATTSPMLGGAPIAIAMLKHAHAAEGTLVAVPCLEHPEGEPVLRQATVQASLRFWAPS